MKKIEVSTVRQTADVEVLFINASLISKVINANNVVKHIIDSAKAQGEIVPRYEPETIENDNGITSFVHDSDGTIKNKPVLDENGNHITDYQNHCIESDELCGLNTQVATLLQELVDAFMA